MREEWNRDVFVETVPHVIRIFARIIIVFAKDGNRSKVVVGKEELSRNIGLANFEHNLTSALLRQLVHESLDHLTTDSIPASVRRHSEIQNPQHGFVKFVDHESDDSMIQFCDSPNTVSLSQTAEKLLFGPWKLKAASFDQQHLVQIAPDEPADLRAKCYQATPPPATAPSPSARRSVTRPPRTNTCGPNQWMSSAFNMESENSSSSSQSSAVRKAV